MRLVVIPRLIRQLTRHGALDNVTEVINARDTVAAQLDALEARVAVHAAATTAFETPAAA
jgi:hypothetical protein